MSPRFTLFACAIIAYAASSAVAGTSRVTRGDLLLENVPDIPASLAARLEQYQDPRAATFLDWDPEGQGMLISKRAGDVRQVHFVGRAGSPARPLMAGADPVFFASFAPDSSYNGFVYLRDTAGDEFFQLYWFDARTQRSLLLSDGHSRNGPPLWTHRGDRFVYTSTRRNGRDSDLYVVRLDDSATSEPLLKLDGTWNVLDWSPDDHRLLLREMRSGSDSRLYVLDLGASTLSQLNPRAPEAEKIAYGRALWAHDGRGIYFVSNEDSEYLRLHFWDGRKGVQSTLTADLPWDVIQLAQSRDGSSLAFTTNGNGVSVLHLFDTWTRRRKPLPDLPPGTITTLGFSPNSRSLAVTLETPQTPGDVYVINLPHRRVQRWTGNEADEFAHGFVSPTTLYYPTFDDAEPGRRRQIPALVYRPPSATAPAPVLIYLHGGPESQAIVGFSPLTQFLVHELGLAVIQPNVRGSAGYGKTFTSLDNGVHREDAVKDIGALLDWIATQPGLDAGHVAVYGGSYGGYMALAAMTLYHDRLAAGVSLAGISNFTTFLQHTQDYRRALRRTEYGDETDPAMNAFFNRISPLARVQALTRPMLIVHGLNDPRVPISEAEQLVAALKANHVEPWYIVATDEGHGFSRKSNRDFFQNALALFLKKHLLAPSTKHAAVAAAGVPP